MLYIFVFLHQTATLKAVRLGGCPLYIFVFLHQTATVERSSNRALALYIFVFLHQTATLPLRSIMNKGFVLLLKNKKTVA